MSADKKKAGQEPEAPKDTGADEPSFDNRLGRLEALVRELESGQLELEPAIARYQEGIGLLKSCHGQLAQYKSQVEELTSAAEQSFEPYDKDPDF